MGDKFILDINEGLFISISVSYCTYSGVSKDVGVVRRMPKHPLYTGSETLLCFSAHTRNHSDEISDHNGVKIENRHDFEVVFEIR